MRSLLSILLACIAFSACTPITPYRVPFGSADAPCIVNCGEAAFQKLDDDVFLGIFEFDDQGALQNRSSKDEIMKRIRGVAETDGALMVVFAHGWLNNAAPDNANLAKFETLLSKLAVRDAQMCNVLDEKKKPRSCAGRKVVGVYLGWRGLSATVEPFEKLSFWNRKSRAHRVGQDGATEIVAELGKISSKTGKKTRLILIGHSFGGALIYSATQQLLMNDTATRWDAIGKVGGDVGAIPRTTAELVVLVNPAFEAARFTSLYEKTSRMEFRETQKPILAIFTSEGDNDTKIAFSLGRYLSSLFTKYNPEHPGQSKLDRTAIGHYPGYQTHELRPGNGTGMLEWQDYLCRWKCYRESQGARALDFGNVVLEDKKCTAPNNPYLNVVVDEAIIADHSKIWQDEFTGFVLNLIAVQNPGKIEDYLDCDCTAAPPKSTIKWK